MKIKLTDDQRQYIINGKTYSRVSDIAGAGEKPWLEAWKLRVGEVEAERIAKMSADYGELVHEITMWNDLKKPKGVKEILKQHKGLLHPLLNWQDWVDAYIEKWILIESIIWSEKWRAAGRLDRLGIIKGDRYTTVVDIKTGSLYDEIGVQIYGGYVPIYNEWRLIQSKKRQKELPIAMRALAVNLPRNNPSAIHVKDYTKAKYLDEFESKAELFQAMNK